MDRFTKNRIKKILSGIGISIAWVIAILYSVITLALLVEVSTGAFDTGLPNLYHYILKSNGDIKPCSLPTGYKIITNGKYFSWEDDTGYRAFQIHDSALEACEYANSYYEFTITSGNKKNWRYLNKEK